MLIASAALISIASARTAGGQEAQGEEHWRDLQKRFQDGEAAATAAFVTGGVDSVPWLIEIMEDPEAGGSRLMAANTLGEIGVPEAVDPLIKALGSDWFNVRRCAALALAKIGDVRAIPAVQNLAENDPFLWTKPDTKEQIYLVRVDAARALKTLKDCVETFMKDASKRPSSHLSAPKEKCRWPFPGKFKEQKLYNNYQQPTDIYVHAAMDLLQEAGTKVRAVQSGTVALVATNYPDWNTHHYFVIEPEAGSGEGWSYTHVDPASFTFKIGDRVRRGQPLGEVVDFSLGGMDGIDHLHLNYVSFRKQPDGKYELTSLYDPLSRFKFSDKFKPTVHTPFHFVRNGTFEPFAPVDGLPEVSGKVDILAAISDCAYEKHIANWMTPVVTLEISGAGIEPLRKLVLDQRGRIADPKQTALYVPSRNRSPFAKDLPPSPCPQLAIVTNTDGDGTIEASDAAHSWNTGMLNEKGQPRFPDGKYTVVVRAWDLAGNKGEARMTVRVRNSKDPR